MTISLIVNLFFIKKKISKFLRDKRIGSKIPTVSITEINDDNTTSLVFGNGILHSSATSSLSEGFYQTEQVGWTIPGETENITMASNGRIANKLKTTKNNFKSFAEALRKGGLTF